MAVLEELQKRNEQLTVELAILRRSNTELEQQRDAAQAATERLKESDANFRKDRQKTQALLDKRQCRIQVLEQQLRAARTENAMLRNRQNESSDTAETTAIMGETVEALNGALSDMRVQWNIAVRAATAYQEDIERLNLVIADLKTECHLREALDDARIVAEEPAEATGDGD